MNSQEYLKSKINNLVVKYPSIKCSYAFDGFDNTHTIEIIPTSFYNHDESFVKDESDIYNEFFQLFPYEGLFFISGENEFPVTNPIYVKSGILFYNYSNFANFGVDSGISIDIPVLISHELSKSQQHLGFSLMEQTINIMELQNSLQDDFWEHIKSNSTIGNNKFALAA
ncbi:MAG TPA: hypothetical protein PKD51_18340 [Saprospiraceae bacterium]|nr:hypothetical protein [Saprospiraceae bacterium]